MRKEEKVPRNYYDEVTGFNPSSVANNLLMTLMSDVHTGKPDDKKEKGGDKTDDKVRKNVNKTVQFYSQAAIKSTSLFCYVLLL